jgi:hypothetical protein
MRIAVLDGSRGLWGRLLAVTVQAVFDFADKARPALLDIISDDRKII